MSGDTVAVSGGVAEGEQRVVSTPELNLLTQLHLNRM